MSMHCSFATSRPQFISPVIQLNWPQVKTCQLEGCRLAIGSRQLLFTLELHAPAGAKVPCFVWLQAVVAKLQQLERTDAPD